MQNVSELAISPEVLRTPFQKESSMTERYRSVIDCINEKSTLVFPSVPFSILQYITSKLGQSGTNWDKLGQVLHFWCKYFHFWPIFVCFSIKALRITHRLQPRLRLLITLYSSSNTSSFGCIVSLTSYNLLLLDLIIILHFSQFRSSS